MYQHKRGIGSILKKTLLVLICSLSVLSVFSQEKKVTLKGNNVPVSQIFLEIEKQTGYSFAYNKTKLDTSKKISISTQNASLKDALLLVLKGTGYSFIINNNRIFLSPAKKQIAQALDNKQPKTQTSINNQQKVITENVAEEKKAEKAQDILIQKDFKSESNIIAPIKNIDVNTSTKVQLLDSPLLPDTFGISKIIDRLNLDAGGRTFKTLSPTFALKTNLLYDLTTTFNLGAELRVGDRYTLDLSVNYNPWTFSHNKKLKHLLIQPELRYWLCEPFNKHFFGAHLMYSRFNVGNLNFPLDILPSLDDYRYQGNLYGGGFSYGYQWYLSPRWSMEATFGFGYFYMDYKKYECHNCGKYIESGDKHYFGPTKAGISLIYMIK